MPGEVFDEQSNDKLALPEGGDVEAGLLKLFELRAHDRGGGDLSSGFEADANDGVACGVDRVSRRGVGGVGGAQDRGGERRVSFDHCEEVTDVRTRVPEHGHSSCSQWRQ